ncbi:aminoglycoside phosphotransferase family protein [Streptomyces sp. RFCAC02]|uniref:aminoglycoside phosphotransferase family protein n=1 Tax=Streptomyces sp. RFCAC02 TaxID=2499143 RepID=UPI001F103BA2|nr:aminoglycoside phosphotransferase family protein [Streptomyces sp. RFCAC02]
MSTPTRMHADEADIDTALVRRLVAAQFPRWRGLPVTPVASSGTDNAMYRLGDTMAVRLPRIPAAVGNVEREQRWLPRLAPHLPVAVPVPLAEGVPGEGFPWPWSVLRWLDGRNPVAGRPGLPDRLAADLATFITALRRADPAGAPPAGRGVPLAERDAPTREALRALRGEIDTRAAGAAWDDALRAPAPEPAPRVWTHGDLSPGNVLVTGDRLSAVIDFGGVGAGDPTVDLSVAWSLLPAASRGVFRAGLGADDATWARGRGRALSIALIQLPYYRDRNPALAATARHVIAEVVADRAGAAGQQS